MAILTATDLSKYFGAQDIFSGVSVQIARDDKVGLVGRNGVGKTTLLRILAGLEEPDSGRVQKARGLRVGYLPQDPDLSGERTLYGEMLTAFRDLLSMQERLRDLENAMADPERRDEVMPLYDKLLPEFETAGGYLYESRIRRVLSGLGFGEEEDDYPLNMLSGGQRTRALLGRLLLEDPDLLLLDEPTIYLDLSAMEWLETYLVEWPKALVVVAHDRYFLDVVATRVWDMESRQIEEYRGNYSHYVETKEERVARRIVEYDAQQKEIKKAEDFIRRYKAGQRTKEARSREHMLKRLKRLERPREMRSMGLSLESHVRGGDVVLSSKNLQVGYRDSLAEGVESHPLFSSSDLLLMRGARVAFLGPNGSGKTTFIRTILEEIPPFSGSVSLGQNVHAGYLAQTHADLDPERTILDQILEVKNLPLGQARSLLGRYLFSNDDVFKPIGDLSGGERSRVALAMLTLQGANLLLLDEPTTHLDISAQEVLQSVLADFDGTIIFVTHDRYLVNGVASGVWEIRDGRLWTYRGNYADYLEAREKEKGREEAQASAEDGRQATRQPKARPGARRGARNLQRVSGLEETISELEGRLVALEMELNAASGALDTEQVQRLSVEYQGVQTELEGCLERWAKLSAESSGEGG